MDKNIVKNISKHLSGKYSQKFLDNPKQSATDVPQTSSKGLIQNSTSNWDLIGDKIADTVAKLYDGRIMKFHKVRRRIIHKQLQINMMKKYLKKDIYLQKRGRKLLMI